MFRRVGASWRWLLLHDPFSLATARLIRHRALLGWLAVFAFLVMLIFPDARWAAVVTLWGIIGAGLVVSVILAEHGELIQRRVWLRQNAGTVGAFLNTVSTITAFVGTVGVGLSRDLTERLTSAPNRAARRRAAGEAREVIRQFLAAEPRPLADLTLDYGLLTRTSQRLTRFLADHSSVLARMTEVQGALIHWQSMTTLAAGELPLPQEFAILDMARERWQDDEAMPQLRRALFTNLASATIDVCERCSDLLDEGGMIPSE